MLLRRVIKHLEEQNWTAVCLDLFIVIFGVFLGIQFANWNTARGEAQAERALLERLHTEISKAQAQDETISELVMNDRMANLLSARRVVFSVSARAELTLDECQAIGYSHFPLVTVGSIPVLSELRATGETALIRDKGIVLAISKATDLFDTLLVTEASNRRKITLLSREFPEFLSMGLEKGANYEAEFEVDEYDPEYACDSAGMRKSAAFRNAFGENVTLHLGLVESGLSPMRETLDTLHKALDNALGAAHEH